MGGAVVRRLVGRCEVNVLDRSGRRAAELEGLGADVSSHLAGVAEQASVVIICVRTDAQVIEVAVGERGLLAHMVPGSVLVVHTTGSPRTAEHLESIATERGIDVLDAPFSGSPAQVAAGAIPILVGGVDGAVDAALPVLSAYGHPVHHLGPVGSGQRMKLLNNLMLTANAEVAAEALRLSAQFGFEPARFAEVVAGCSGRSFALEVVAASAGAMDHLGTFLAKDIDVALAVAAELDADLGSLGRIVTDARRRFDVGRS